MSRDGSVRPHESWRAARRPLATSYPASTASTSRGTSSGGFCRSPSIVTTIPPRARESPACIAGCWPTLRLSRTARTCGSRRGSARASRTSRPSSRRRRRAPRTTGRTPRASSRGAGGAPRASRASWKRVTTTESSGAPPASLSRTAVPRTCVSLIGSLRVHRRGGTSLSTMGWQPGEIVVHREVWRGTPWQASPVVVVEDAPELLATYIPEEAPFAFPPSADGRPHPGRGAAAGPATACSSSGVRARPTRSGTSGTAPSAGSPAGTSTSRSRSGARRSATTRRTSSSTSGSRRARGGASRTRRSSRSASATGASPGSRSRRPGRSGRRSAPCSTAASAGGTRAGPGSSPIRRGAPGLSGRLGGVAGATGASSRSAPTGCSRP